MAAIQKLDLTRLHTEEAFAFFQLVQSETQYLTDDLTKSSVEQFKTTVSDFDGALKESASVPSAALVSELDAKRDFACNGIFAMGRVMATYHPDSDVRATWQKAYDAMRKYGNPAELSQTEESGIIHNLLQDLNAIPTDELRYAGADVWIESLDSVESEFLAAVASRTVEEAARVNGIVKQTRQAAEAAYRTLVALVNALAGVNAADYADFISHLNVLIDRQKTVLKTRATLSAKKAESGASAETEEA